MDNRKDDSYYLEKLCKDLHLLPEHTSSLSWENFGDDEVLLDSIMFRLIQISENASRLSDGLKNANKSIPWMAIKGLRNRIVHEYGDVDYRIVFDTVKNDIPVLYKMLSSVRNGSTCT